MNIQEARRNKMSNRKIYSLLIALSSALFIGCGETDDYKKTQEEAKNWKKPDSATSKRKSFLPTLLRKNMDLNDEDPRVKIIKSLSREREKGTTVFGVLKRDGRDLSKLINSELSNTLNQAIKLQQEEGDEVNANNVANSIAWISSGYLVNTDIRFNLKFEFGTELNIDNYVEMYWQDYYEDMSDEQKSKHFNDEFKSNLVCGVSDVFNLKEPFDYDGKHIDKGFLLTCGNYFNLNK